MIRRPPRSTQSRSSAASDVYKRQARRRVRNPLALPLSPFLLEREPHLHDEYLVEKGAVAGFLERLGPFRDCLLYTSDAADDLLCVDLGGRRIIKKKKN